MRLPPAHSLLAVCVALVGCGESSPTQPPLTTPFVPPVCLSPEWISPPACGSGSASWESVIPAPGSPDHDAELALKADRFDRQFHVFSAHGTGVNADLGVPLDRVEDRAQIAAFLGETDGWDFEAYAGKPVTAVVGTWAKVAGAYGGAGIAADAYRYATLRDRGAACAAIDLARSQLLLGLDALHLASAITGVPGVIARGFARTDVPGDGQANETTPLFDSSGAPLPVEKNNGTWRADNSGGVYPDYVWEDSCSRDMLVGWALGYNAAWQVIHLDPTVPDAAKTRMQQDAAAIGRSLMKTGQEGYDLEILDADGRRTYHGILNENSLDRLYLPDAKNGFNALLALGIVGTLAYVSEAPDVVEFLYDKLVGARELHLIARDEMALVDLGAKSNYSNYNMSFSGGWLATRCLCGDETLTVTRAAVREALYSRPGRDRQPDEQKQSFYDLVYAASTLGDSVWDGQHTGALDEAALARGIETLVEFSPPPFWDEARVNCDVAEIESAKCEGLDGTPFDLLGFVGHGDKLVAVQPAPMRVRPLSNYFWRSNPYEVNGEGDGSRLLPGVDFRLAYWMGRHMRR